MPDTESLCFVYNWNPTSKQQPEFFAGNQQEFCEYLSKRSKQPAHAQIHYITVTFSFQLTQPQKLWTVFRFSRATTIFLKFAMIKIKSKNLPTDINTRFPDSNLNRKLNTKAITRFRNK